MQCPHCQAQIEVKFHTFALGEDPDASWQVATTRCPACDRIIAQLATDSGRTYPAWPPTSLRPRLSEDVPEPWRSHYFAACQVLPFSEEAAAALARQLLWRLLREQLGLQGEDLLDLVSKATMVPQLPSYLKEALDLYAKAANLNTDSSKSAYPDRLVPAQPGEAGWTLDVVESLLEFEFVAKAKVERRISALKERLSHTQAPDDVVAQETSDE